MPTDSLTATDELLPLNRLTREIPGNPSPATVWRWITKGLKGIEEQAPRIKLKAVYCGSRPFVSRAAITEFFAAVTAARLARLERTQQHCADVSESELRAAGLT